MCMPGDNVRLSIELHKPIAMDDGVRFAIREGGRTVGLGRGHEDPRVAQPAPWWSGCRGVAQLAEHRSPKPGVASSIPAAPAITSCIGGERLPVSAAGAGISVQGCRRPMSQEKVASSVMWFGELFQVGVYKRSQGRIARQVTFAALAIAFALAAWRARDLSAGCGSAATWLLVLSARRVGGRHVDQFPAW